MACIVRGGLVFDGNGGEGQLRDVLIHEGRVKALLAPGTPTEAESIDARGCWVTPGFVDCHTHYDAEIEFIPALTESLRHGITTVTLGSCGLSMAVGRPVDLADMFCRVEGIPRRYVLPLLEKVKDWETPAEYLEHLAKLPLGPNICSLLGHSAMRAAVMGIGRSVEAGVQPTQDELDRMTTMLNEALDVGYLGLSINTLPWDKMDGKDWRSRPTPSVYAGWSEYRHLMKPLRARGRIFQGVPDISTKINAVLFFLATMGVGRPSLKTMVITLLDTKADRGTFRLVGLATRFVNGFFRGQIRFQSLPHPFDIWSDGLEVPVLEELVAGAEAIHLEDPAERSALLRTPAYRARFKKQWRSWFGKAYHRDLREATIIGCPDPAVVNKSFGEVADQRGIDAEDAFLDLNADHGNALRWRSIIGNDRPEWVKWIMSHPGVLIGFSDAGAHLRNMAFYNFPIRMLKRVNDAEKLGQPFMSVGRAVQRCSAEIADYLAVDAGRLVPGSRADLVIIDPAHLDDSVEQLHEAPIPEFGEFRRMVRRNDEAVRTVMVNGAVAWNRGVAAQGLGSERAFGQVLRAQL